MRFWTILLMLVVGLTTTATASNFRTRGGTVSLPAFGTLAPSSAWTGGPNCGSTCAGAYVSSFQVPSTATAEAGNGYVELTVPNTAGFAATGVCYVFGGYGTDEANGQHPCKVLDGTHLELTGVTFVNPWGGIPTGTNTYVAQVYGAQTVSNITAQGGTGQCLVTLASTATMATNDRYTLSDSAGTNCNGTFTITKVSNTQIALGTPANPGPQFSGSYTGGGVVGVDEQAIGNFDEYSEKIIEANNSEYITIGAAIPNRGWINSVKCQLEDSPVFSAVKQIQNPVTGSLGWTVQINASNADGLAELNCDIIPTNGLPRTISTYVWLNVPGLTNVIDRTSAAHSIYVDNVAGHDPAGTPGTFSGCAAPCTVSTDATGKIASFWTGCSVSCVAASPAPPTAQTIIMVCAAACASNDTITAWSQIDPTLTSGGCTGNVCTLISSIGANLPTSTNFTNARGATSNCGGRGTSSLPVASIDYAVQCVAALNAGAGTSTGGGTVFVNNTTGVPYVLPVHQQCNAGVCPGNATKTLNRMVQVVPFTASAAVTITGVTWSAGVATYTTTTNAFANGNTIQITGMEPPEFNTTCTASGVTTTSFQCSLQPYSCNVYPCSPFTKHPGMTTIYGTAVRPIQMELLYAGLWNPPAPIVQYKNAWFDTNTFNTVGVVTGTVTSQPQPYDNGIIVLQNSSWWCSCGPDGPTYGWVPISLGGAYGLLSSSTFPGIGVVSFAETNIQTSGTLAGLRLMRNVNGTVTTGAVSLGGALTVNAAIFNATLPMPLNSSNAFVGQPTRATKLPVDNITTANLPTITTVGAYDSGGNTTQIDVNLNGANGSAWTTTTVANYNSLGILIPESGNCAASVNANPPQSLQGPFNTINLNNYSGGSLYAPAGGFAGWSPAGHPSAGHIVVNMLGNWNTGCGAYSGAGLGTGDEVYISQDNHPDYLQLLINGNSNAPTVSQNFYAQRYYVTGENYFLSQAGTYGQGGLTLSGTFTSGQGTAGTPLTMASTIGATTGAYVSSLNQTSFQNAIPSGDTVASISPNTNIALTNAITGTIGTSTAGLAVGYLTCNVTTCQDQCLVASGCSTNYMQLQVGDYVYVYSPGSPQQYEARKVIGATLANTAGATNKFFIDQPFQPSNFSSNAVVYVQSKAALDIACILCRWGGISTGGAQPENFLQHASENWVFVQSTSSQGSFYFENTPSAAFAGCPAGCQGTVPSQGHATAQQNFAVYDSFIGHSNLSNLTSMSLQSPTPQYFTYLSNNNSGPELANDGYIIDNNNYDFSNSNTNFEPGSNVGLTASVLSDLNYTPDNTLTQAVIGTKGNAYVPDGTPLVPFNADGVSITAGHVVGAMP